MAFITVPLFYDLDLLRFTTAAGGIALQPNLVLGQSDNINFLVQFVSGGQGYDLGDPSFIFGIKAINDTSGVYLVQSTLGQKQNTGTATKYMFEVVLDSTELRAWLLTVTSVSNYAALSIRDTTNEIVTLPALTCTILPDYTLVGTTPTSSAGTLIVDSGQTFTVHKTFAMPVDDGTNTYILQTNGSGVGSWVAKPSGGVTSVAQSFTGGIVSVGGSPVTTSGTLALTVAGTSGGLVYFSSNSAWASSAVMGAGALVVGGGAGATPTALAAVASGRVLTSAGTLTTPAYSSTITLGASGTLGTITLGNATSGTILITPPTGALGTPTLTLPITSTTLAGLSVAQTFTAAQTFSQAVSLTLDSDATSSTTGGTLTVTGGASVSKKLFVGTLLDIVATTATAGQITQAGARLFHTFGGTGNIWLGLTTGNTAGALVGTNNLGIGTSAGKSMTSGANNLLIGGNSGEFITSGYNNCCVGISSGYNIGTGILNVAIGYSALQFGGSGGYNCAIGQASLQNITSGTLNTCIGSDAGDVDGVVVGGLTGKNITSGGNNTIIGAGAGTTLATGNYRTAIGSDSRCQNNNAIKLGRDENDVVILPSMTTTQRNAYATPVGGSLIFNSTTSKLNFYNGTAWEAVTSA